jgi:hypothetical protein
MPSQKVDYISQCLCATSYRPSILCFRFCGSDDQAQTKLEGALEFIYKNAKHGDDTFIPFRTRVPESATRCCIAEPYINAQRSGRYREAATSAPRRSRHVTAPSLSHRPPVV